MKIYTKAGDKGTTSLFGGKRLSKNHIRIEAYGTVDELNAHLGLLKDEISDEHWDGILFKVQNILFTIGSNLATENPEEFKIPNLEASEIELLENEIDEMNLNLEPLRAFILPGGDRLGSLCHICRVVCRRAERRVVALSEEAQIDELIITYLNRLSDYFFVLSRAIVKKNGSEEIYWNA